MNFKDIYIPRATTGIWYPRHKTNYNVQYCTTSIPLGSTVSVVILENLKNFSFEEVLLNNQEVF